MQNLECNKKSLECNILKDEDALYDSSSIQMFFTSFVYTKDSKYITAPGRLERFTIEFCINKYLSKYLRNWTWYSEHKKFDKVSMYLYIYSYHQGVKLYMHMLKMPL